MFVLNQLKIKPDFLFVIPAYQKDKLQALIKI